MGGWSLLVAVAATTVVVATLEGKGKVREKKRKKEKKNCWGRISVDTLELRRCWCWWPSTQHWGCIKKKKEKRTYVVGTLAPIHWGWGG